MGGTEGGREGGREEPKYRGLLGRLGDWAMGALEEGDRGHQGRAIRATGAIGPMGNARGDVNRGGELTNGD